MKTNALGFAALAALGIGSLGGCEEPLGFAWDVRGSPGFDDAVADTTVAPEVPVVTGPCPIADNVFTPNCVRCHNGAKDYPDLRAGALGRLVGAATKSYPGHILVVAGDPAASFLMTKVHGPSAGQGALMPPGAALTTDLQDQITAWINDGAKACDGVVDPGPVDPIVPEPGGPITFSNPPTGFQATHPSWAEAGTCTSQQWWKYEGDTESANMHPGQACIECHTNSEDAPGLTYAGTVFANVADTRDCRGVQGVAVEILNDAGTTLMRTTTTASGNFRFDSDLYSFIGNYRARLSYQGRTREMTLPQASNGDCNTCHGTVGTEGAPGRMVAP